MQVIMNTSDIALIFNPTQNLRAIFQASIKQDRENWFDLHHRKNWLGILAGQEASLFLVKMKYIEELVVRQGEL